MRWALSMTSRLNWCQPIWWSSPWAMPSHTWDRTAFGPCSTIQAPLSLWLMWCLWWTRCFTTFCLWANEQNVQETVTRCHHIHLSHMTFPAIPPQTARLLYPGTAKRPSRGTRNLLTTVGSTLLTQLGVAHRRGRATTGAASLTSPGLDEVQRWSIQLTGWQKHHREAERAWGVGWCERPQRGPSARKGCGCSDTRAKSYGPSSASTVRCSSWTMSCTPSTWVAMDTEIHWNATSVVIAAKIAMSSLLT